LTTWISWLPTARASGLELGLHCRAQLLGGRCSLPACLLACSERRREGYHLQKPIGRNNVEDGSKARYQEQTRQAGQSHGSIVGVSCILPVPGPEPWQSCRIASISSGHSCSRHAQKLNPCPPPAAPRSTSPASYPSFASPFHLSSFCLAVSIVVTPSIPFLHIWTPECDTFFYNHTSRYTP
jgi:hypothetical protein